MLNLFIMLYKSIVSVQYHFVIWFFRGIGRVFSTRPGLKELAFRKFLSRAKAIKAATTSDKCATCSPMKTACSPVQSNAFENFLLWHPSATLLQKLANRSNGCLGINLTTVNLSSTSGYLRQPRPSPHLSSAGKWSIFIIFKKHDYRIIEYQWILRLYMTLHDLMMSRKVTLKINCDTSTKYVWNIHMDMGQNLWHHNWRWINSHLSTILI